MKILSPAQTDIMLAIWNAGKPLKRSELQQLLVDKNWKVTTINTFLSKLVEAGFLKIEHDRRDYVYHPLIEKEEYLSYEGNSVLKKLYGNSMGNFLAAITHNRKMTNDDIEEIESFLKGLKGE